MSVPFRFMALVISPLLLRPASFYVCQRYTVYKIKAVEITIHKH